VTDKELKALPITPHEWHGEWNYTVAARRPRTSQTTRKVLG
jgi:hypothetical protein